MRSKATLWVTLAVALVLAVQEYFGVVQTHSLFGDEALPEMSNWWGLVSLPALTWLTLGQLSPAYDGEALLKDGICALLFGAALAVCHEHGRRDLFEFLGEGLVLLALSYPIYRAGCLLGFVFGATYAFGPVVPVLVACALRPAAYLLHDGLRMTWSMAAALSRAAGSRRHASRRTLAPRRAPASRTGQQNMQPALHSPE